MQRKRWGGIRHPSWLVSERSLSNSQMDNGTYLHSADAIALLLRLSWYSQIKLQCRVSAQVILTANQQVGYSWTCVADFRYPLDKEKKGIDLYVTNAGPKKWIITALISPFVLCFETTLVSYLNESCYSLFRFRAYNKPVDKVVKYQFCTLLTTLCKDGGCPISKQIKMTSESRYISLLMLS